MKIKCQQNVEELCLKNAHDAKHLPLPHIIEHLDAEYESKVVQQKIYSHLKKNTKIMIFSGFQLVTYKVSL